MTGKTSASASLPYYVMTGLCLLLGTVGLALPESAVASLRRHWLAGAIGLSLAVPVVRILLERSAAPPGLAWAFGVTALPPLVGAYFAVRARAEGKALARRGGRAGRVRAERPRMDRAAVRVRDRQPSGLHSFRHVAGADARTTRSRAPCTCSSRAAPWQLVTLVVVPQLAVWPVYTVLAGLLGAGLCGCRPRPRAAGAKPVPPVEMAAGAR